MPAWDWLTKSKTLNAAALTVRAQRLPENDNGKLLYPLFFKKTNVKSMEAHELVSLDYRPVAGRREWNAPERRIDLPIPAQRDLEFIPIGADHMINEKEIDRISNQVDGNEQVFRNLIGADIPSRAEMLAMACKRQMELDCFEAWTDGTLTQVDPQTGNYYVVSYGISSDRIQVAGTAWSAAANAYLEFIDWLKDAKQAIGPLEGVLAKSDVYDTILADVPQINGLPLRGDDLLKRIKDDAQIDRFGFFEHNGTVDKFINGGRKKTRVDVFADRKMVAIPRGGIVGDAAYAPVARAREIARQMPQAKINLNDVTIFYFGENDDKALKIVAQLNAYPAIEEQNVFSINIGAA
ncbi:MAG TPA: hypothetical protein PKY82_02035 [Pyrinomonadaceae bacterium]|nr:hypothetical protein [Pyrinomonadaceae bacterium]